MPVFKDRTDAGRRLADILRRRGDSHNVIVLAVPRGGVVVGFELARALRAPLDIFVVNRIGAPGNPTVTIGAVASGGVKFINNNLVRRAGIPKEAVDAAAAAALRGLADLEESYRRGTPPIELRDRTVLLVDDGITTGTTMRAALRAIRARTKARTVVTVPVASPEGLDAVMREADDVACIMAPPAFKAPGEWYENFTPVEDSDVWDILAARMPGGVPPEPPPPQEPSRAADARNTVQPPPGVGPDTKDVAPSRGEAAPAPEEHAPPRTMGEITGETRQEEPVEVPPSH